MQAPDRVWGFELERLGFESGGILGRALFVSENFPQWNISFGYEHEATSLGGNLLRKQDLEADKKRRGLAPCPSNLQ